MKSSIRRYLPAVCVLCLVTAAMLLPAPAAAGSAEEARIQRTIADVIQPFLGPAAAVAIALGGVASLLGYLNRKEGWWHGIAEGMLMAVGILLLPTFIKIILGVFGKQTTGF